MVNLIEKSAIKNLEFKQSEKTIYNYWITWKYLDNDKGQLDLEKIPQLIDHLYSFKNLNTRKIKFQALLVLIDQVLPALGINTNTKLINQVRKVWDNLNVLTRVEQSEKFKSVPDIKEVRDWAKAKFTDTSRPDQRNALLLLDIFTLFPFRNELATMLVYPVGKSPKSDDENYIELNEDGTATINLNQYKTKEYYGSKKYILPEWLVNKWDVGYEYNRDGWFEPTYAVPLFAKQRGSVYSGSAFSTWVNRMFQDYPGKININILRKMSINHLYDSAETLSDKVKVVKAANTSIEVMKKNYLNN